MDAAGGCDGAINFHLDEVQVIASGSSKNIALGKSANQSSVSQWSSMSPAGTAAIAWADIVSTTIVRGLNLAAKLHSMGVASDVVGAVPKVQPRMNLPSLGVSREETGKYALGTVPVHADGSAYFQVPSGVSVFFQALDRDGYALQTMRSLTYVQPGETLACIGCHEQRNTTPSRIAPLAMMHALQRPQPEPTRHLATAF